MKLYAAPIFLSTGTFFSTRCTRLGEPPPVSLLSWSMRGLVNVPDQTLLWYLKAGVLCSLHRGGCCSSLIRGSFLFPPTSLLHCTFLLHYTLLSNKIYTICSKLYYTEHLYYTESVYYTELLHYNTSLLDLTSLLDCTSLTQGETVLPIPTKYQNWQLGTKTRLQ